MSRSDGAAEVDLGGGRYADFNEQVLIDGNYTSSTFAAHIRAAPNAGGSPLAVMTIGTPSFAAGITSFPLLVPKLTMSGLPANADDPSADSVLFYDLVMITAGSVRVLFAGTFTVIGGVTQ
jgi:hypothetical protein